MILTDSPHCLDSPAGSARNRSRLRIRLSEAPITSSEIVTFRALAGATVYVFVSSPQ